MTETRRRALQGTLRRLTRRDSYNYSKNKNQILKYPEGVRAEVNVLNPAGITILPDHFISFGVIPGIKSLFRHIPICRCFDLKQKQIRIFLERKQPFYSKAYANTVVNEVC